MQLDFLPIQCGWQVYKRRKERRMCRNFKKGVMHKMKKTRSKIIIKTRAGGYTKIYANGKWQKKVCVIDYHAECSNKDGIKVTYEFDRLKTDKNGSVIYDEAKKDFAKEHIVARI